MLEVIAALPENLLFDIGLILVVATFIGYLLKVFRQPLIPAYIIAGLILGPMGFGIIQDVEVINTLSEIGILFLLFIVGMEMDLSKLKKLGAVTVFTAVLQVALTFLAGFGLATWLGFDSLNAVYAGLIIAFSSTMIVIKLLHDKEELQTLHGRIVIGILFVQDIIVVLALTVLLGTTEFSVISVLPVLLKFLVLVFIAYLINKYLAFRIFRVAARSTELLFLLAVATCFLFAMGAYLFGFSVAIGGFIAGLTLSTLPYHMNIMGNVSPLKDFFATIFFVSLGLQLAIANFSAIMQPFFFFLAIVLILKPLIIMTLLSFFGYDKRNAWVTAVSLAQISEFSLILVISLQSVSQELFSMTILLGVISIGLTAYIMKYELYVYNAITPVLALFEKLGRTQRHLGFEYTGHKSVILFGANRIGGMFLKNFEKVQKHVLVVDFNPEVIEQLKEQKISSLYGDMTNREILRRINFKKAKIVISTVAQEEDTLRLLSYVKKIKTNATIFVTSGTIHEALSLYDAGADYVILPHIMSGEKIADILERCMDDKKKLRKIKREHLKHLLETHADHR